MNKAIIIGNVGSADIRATSDGSTVLNLSVATNEYGKDKQKYTTWHKVVCFGRLADACKGLSKGDKIGVEGQIAVRPWEDRDGRKREDHFIKAFKIEFLTRRQESHPADEW